MIVETNQIFNLMDTNGRRSDVLNALKIYLEILEELKEVYPTESWGTYPDSLSQFLFYEKALEKSKDVFKIHSNYDNFISELQGCLSNAQDEIGGLIITGDITSTAEKNGFEKATKLIDDLSRNYVFTNENIAICPGNHDFKFSPKDLDVDEKPKAVAKRYTKAYSNFYKSVYNISPNEYYCCGKKILLSSGHVVEIVALNSIYLQQHQNFNGHGYLSEKQLNFVETEMGWNNKKARNVIRIVMMHHHYLPVCYTEAIDVKRASSVVYDADRLMNWMIKHDVKVLLHGHKHKSIVAQVTYPNTSFSNENNETQMKKISVIGMGGTGCKHTQNLFGTLGFDDNKLYIKFYQIYSDESFEDSEYQTIVLPLER